MITAPWLFCLPPPPPPPHTKIIFSDEGIKTVIRGHDLEMHFYKESLLRCANSMQMFKYVAQLF